MNSNKVQQNASTDRSSAYGVALATMRCYAQRQDYSLHMILTATDPFVLQHCANYSDYVRLQINRECRHIEHGRVSVDLLSTALRLLVLHARTSRSRVVAVHRRRCDCCIDTGGVDAWVGRKLANILLKYHGQMRYSSTAPSIHTPALKTLSIRVLT